MNKPNMTDKRTYNKLMSRSDEPYRIICVQQHLSIDEKGVLNTISIDRATATPSDDTNTGRGDERDAVKGEEAIIENEHQASEGKVAKSKRCDTDDRGTNTAPAEIKIIDAHQPCEYKDPNINDEEDGGQTSEQAKTQKSHLGKPITRWNNVRKDVVDAKEYTEEQNVGRMKENGRTHFSEQLYRYTSKTDKVKPPKDLKDLFIAW